MNFNTSQIKVMVYSQGVNTATVENYYMYITGMALTTSQISLGLTSNGTTITGTNGNLNIAGINANFQYTNQNQKTPSQKAQKNTG